jgi:hypothetical protein
MDRIGDETLARLLRDLHGWHRLADSIWRTYDDLTVASRIQRLVGDHRHPVGRAAPWIPSGPLTGVRERPVRPAGP